MKPRKILDSIDENLLIPKPLTNQRSTTGLKIAGLRIDTNNALHRGAVSLVRVLSRAARVQATYCHAMCRPRPKAMALPICLRSHSTCSFYVTSAVDVLTRHSFRAARQTRVLPLADRTPPRSSRRLRLDPQTPHSDANNVTRGPNRHSRSLSRVARSNLRRSNCRSGRSKKRQRS